MSRQKPAHPGAQADTDTKIFLRMGNTLNVGIYVSDGAEFMFNN